MRLLIASLTQAPQALDYEAALHPEVVDGQRTSQFHEVFTFDGAMAGGVMGGTPSSGSPVASRMCIKRLLHHLKRGMKPVTLEGFGYARAQCTGVTASASNFSANRVSEAHRLIASPRPCTPTATPCCTSDLNPGFGPSCRCVHRTASPEGGFMVYVMNLTVPFQELFGTWSFHRATKTAAFGASLGAGIAGTESAGLEKVPISLPASPVSVSANTSATP